MFIYLTLLCFGLFEFSLAETTAKCYCVETNQCDEDKYIITDGAYLVEDR